MSRLACLALAFGAAVLASTPVRASDTTTAHDFAFDGIDGSRIELGSYAGRPLVIVNTASFCGFTDQYAGLQSLWERYRDRGLVVIGVPSNDFGGQEPGSNSEIKDFCEVSFAIDFPLTAKSHVRGPNAHPFYKWAGSAARPQARPAWNFHKILVDGNGRVVRSFPSATKPTSREVLAAIETTLRDSVGHPEQERAH